MPSMMAARWVGQNSGPIFRRLWTKVHRIKFACAGVYAVWNAVFRLTISCCVPETFAIKSRSCAKSRRNFDVFGPPNFRGGTIQVSDRISGFCKSGSQSNIWQRLVTIGQATSEKKDLNYNGKTEWPAASIARVRP